jgi:MFS family permease
MSSDLILIALSLITWGVGEGMFLYFEPLYLQQLGADPLLIGSILGIAALAMAISYIPAGIISDHFGRRPLLRAAWLIGMVAAWTMALANTLPMFVAGMALYGFTSFVVVPMNSYITHARGNWSVGRTITMISSFFSLGFIIGPLLGGWIGTHYGLQRTFMVGAIIFLISTIIIFFVRPQPVERKVAESETKPWKTLINRQFILFLLVVLVVTFCLQLPQPLSQNFLQNERGLNLTQIGLLIAARSLGVVILSLTLGRLDARLGYLLAQAGVALFALLLWKGDSMPWYLAAYFMLGSYQPARALAVAQGRTLIQAKTMGLGYGLIETAMTSALVLAPPLAGLLYDINPPLVYAASLVLIPLAIAMSAVLLPRRISIKE